MAILAAAAIIGAGTAIYSAVDAKNKEKKAKSSLDEWNKNHPQDFRSAKQIYDEAAAMTPTGYSPAETAAFNQSMARRSNTARRIATDRNPNLSGAVNAGINYGNINGMLQFAANDAAVRRSLISEKAGMIRGQSNAQTQFNQNVAGEYGQAIRQQKQNFTNSMYNVANNVGALGYYYGGSGGVGGKTTQPQPTGATNGMGGVGALGGQAPLTTLQAPPAGSNINSPSYYGGQPNAPFTGMINNPVPSGPVQQRSFLSNTYDPYSVNTNPYYTTPYGVYK